MHVPTPQRAARNCNTAEWSIRRRHIPAPSAIAARKPTTLVGLQMLASDFDFTLARPPAGTVYLRDAQ
ncbi:hypothetical protein ACFRU3_35585 [Streptomyces sp. NPDC056910]|uniref:hypothetical protein n=1 Tax=Streptomyces sp. NPDC056910 TaxID=3345964 RepID=UPI003680994D